MFNAKYSNPPISPVGRTYTGPSGWDDLEWQQKREEQDFLIAYANADLMLKTEDWESFEETRPLHVTAMREKLRDLLLNKKQPFYGIAFVIVPQYRFFRMDEKPPPSHRAELEQILKDAGFWQIYFCTERDLLSVQ